MYICSLGTKYGLKVLLLHKLTQVQLIHASITIFGYGSVESSYISTVLVTTIDWIEPNLGAHS